MSSFKGYLITSIKYPNIKTEYTIHILPVNWFKHESSLIKRHNKVLSNILIVTYHFINIPVRPLCGLNNSAGTVKGQYNFSTTMRVQGVLFAVW